MMESDEKEFILYIHNIAQCLILLDKGLRDNKKYFKKVIKNRDSSRRAGQTLLDIEDTIFPTRGEKLLFLSMMNSIADNTADIAGLLEIKGLSLPSSLYEQLEVIVQKLVGMGKSLSFDGTLETKGLVENVHNFRSSIYKNAEAKDFYILNKVADKVKKIIYSLEKANQF